jgi:DNA-directed RNA polymerase specialized sigma24 family protein
MRAFHSEGGSDALERLQREIDRRIDAVAEQTLAMERSIDAVKDVNQREVLRYRYLNGWDWREIARRMNYSTDWVKHIHSQALKAMEVRGTGNGANTT